MIFVVPFSLIGPIEQELKKDKIVIVTDHYFRNVLEITNKNILIADGQSHEVNTINELREQGYLKQ